MVEVVKIEKPPAVEVLIERFGWRERAFVLDSSQSNDGLGEWSFFGAEPFDVLRGGRLADLRALMAGHVVENTTGIPFVGGAVGFIAYDYGRVLERLPVRAVDDRGLPDLEFGLYDGVAALEHATGILYLVALGIRGPVEVTLRDLEAIVWTPVEASCLAPRVGAWEWNMSPDVFREKVEAVKGWIASGDVYQVNLSQRARCAFAGDVLGLHGALRAGNPAPYGAFLDFGDFQLLSTSPELFLRKRGRVVETRPIKGTRARGRDAVEDAAYAAELRSSEKERAELLMIVDLERNDLGRVAEFGSVRVEGLYHLERYARVMHQTAQVFAELASGYDVFDCIEALFPGGSITGAPKVRAMEIIEELEPTRRGAYCGAMGYVGFDGDAQLNIAIRSLHVKDGVLDYQVGSGIVWDSDAESEYLETMAKGRAIREAVEVFSSSV